MTSDPTPTSRIATTPIERQNDDPDHGQSAEEVDIQVTDFELPNVAGNPDPFSLFDYANLPDIDVVVLVFQRDFHCVFCRRQVQKLADRYEEFQNRGASVVSVLPESIDRARSWQDQYALPFPLLADESKVTGDRYGQQTRFGILGGVHDVIGRMPETVIFDTRAGAPRLTYVHRGRMPADRPSVDDLLGHVDTVLSADLSN